MMYEKIPDLNVRETAYHSHIAVMLDLNFHTVT